MKTFIVLIGLFCVCALAQDDDKCPLMMQLKRSMEECVESMNPSEETLKLVAEGKGNQNEESKCLFACTLKKVNLMTDAKLDVDTMEKLMRSAPEPNETKISEAVKALKKCKAESETSDNECEVAGKYLECLQDEKSKNEK